MNKNEITGVLQKPSFQIARLILKIPHKFYSVGDRRQQCLSLYEKGTDKTIMKRIIKTTASRKLAKLSLQLFCAPGRSIS